MQTGVQSVEVEEGDNFNSLRGFHKDKNAVRMKRAQRALQRDMTFAAAFDVAQDDGEDEGCGGDDGYDEVHA
jgi:hypothetical protein